MNRCRDPEFLVPDGVADREGRAETETEGVARDQVVVDFRAGHVREEPPLWVLPH